MATVRSAHRRVRPQNTYRIVYCKRCVMPATKPDLHIDEEGVCSACRYMEQRPTVNWDARRAELVQILEKYRSEDGTNWDCIVPVSGGKDSTYQIVTMLELGMNPLAVTATTCKLSELGRKNLDNLHKLGVDSIEMTPNPKVRRMMNRIGLEQVGDISWPEHVGIFTIPVRAAVQYNVPLIIWGENSQHEYGGPASAAQNNVLSRRWLEEFGGLLGLRVSDLEGQYGIEPRHLIPYRYPTDDDLQRAGVTGLFLGYYLPWNGYANAEIAKEQGFTFYDKFVEGSIVDYENLDNCHTGIHDYFKFLKYGFGRATDLACLHIRHGRMSREEALELVKQHDGKFPWTYLGCSLDEIIDEMDMTVDDFIQICDRFTNKKLFRRDESGNLLKDAAGNLTKINYDNE